MYTWILMGSIMALFAMFTGILNSQMRSVGLGEYLSFTLFCCTVAAAILYCRAFESYLVLRELERRGWRVREYEKWTVINKVRYRDLKFLLPKDEFETLPGGTMCETDLRMAIRCIKQRRAYRRQK